MSTESEPAFLIEAFDAEPHPQAMSGVLFAEEFDLAHALPPARRASDRAPVKTFGAADLDAARAQGLLDGRDAAAAELDTAERRSAEATRGAVLRALAAADRSVQDVATAHCNALCSAMMRVLAAALPQLCALHGPAEAAALAAALMPMLAQEPRVSIRANPHSLPALQDVLARLLTEPDGRVRLVGTDALSEGDVEIEWQDGSARRDSAALRRALDQMLLPLGVCAEAAPHPAHAEKELADAG